MNSFPFKRVDDSSAEHKPENYLVSTQQSPNLPILVIADPIKWAQNLSHLCTTDKSVYRIFPGKLPTEWSVDPPPSLYLWLQVNAIAIVWRNDDGLYEKVTDISLLWSLAVYVPLDWLE